ncbi:MAG: hypothetical protein R2771_03180 [Saprospiraceae bacterium]
MLIPDNSEYIRDWTYKSIGLSCNYLSTIEKNTYYIEKSDIKKLIRQRKDLTTKVIMDIP